ncbi:MAG: carboxypeptidase-like regulatory domain-containing protein [Acidobacteriota bacterium]
MNPSFHHRCLGFALVGLLTAALAVAQGPATEPEPVVDVRTLLAVAPTQGWSVALDPESGRVLRSTTLVVAAQDLADGWLELTPLGTAAPAAVIRLGDRSAADGDLRIPPRMADGVAILCSGGEALAVLCEQIYLESAVWLAADASADIEVRFEPGLAVSGRYLLDGWAVVGARVAAVPVGVEAGRAFTMPLELGSSEGDDGSLRREVMSDAEGRFVLPPLAAGAYFLETVLPSGRVHRSSPFELPSPDSARRESGAEADATVTWDLGEIDVAEGLVVAFQVTDWRGQPLAGALVAARQGSTPSTLVRFEAATDAEGQARLSGLSPDHPVHLSCRRPGYLRIEREAPLLPVQFSCALEPLAAVAGEVIGIDGQVPEGLAVSITAVAESALAAALAAAEPGEDPALRESSQASKRSPEPVELQVDDEGAFIALELAAGVYRVRAAAPGFEAVDRELELEPGQRLIMESIVLPFGRRLEARVIEKDSERPLAGVEVTAVSPPGAVAAVSDAEGMVRFADPGSDRLVLRLLAAEHASREISLSKVQREAQQPLVFEMERAGWLRALVWEDRQGVPCQGCRLMLQPSAVELLTDGSGEALSEPLLPGRYRVYRPRVTHLGSSVVEQDDAEYRSVRIEPGEIATVRFGELRRQLRVRFNPGLPPAPGGAPWSLSVRARRHVERYWPEADGSFIIDQPPQQAVQLFLQTYVAETASEMEIWQVDLAAEGLDRELTLELGSAAVTGRASVSGEPLAGEWMHLKTLGNATVGSVKTRADGSFHLPLVPAGIYAVAIGDLNITFASLRSGVTLDLGAFQLLPGGF